MTAVATRPTHRGTSNSDDRGNTRTRLLRRQWLVGTYRADVDALIVTWPDGKVDTLPAVPELVDTYRAWSVVKPACRCYRCGCLLTEDTVTVDRITPGCEGGTYDRSNIRPACLTDNSSTGGRLGNLRKAARR